ncbi:MAG: hypothetical protein V1495_04995 [Pseudomonadota bacterium]
MERGPREDNLPWAGEDRTLTLYTRIEPTLADGIHERRGELSLRTTSDYLRHLITKDLLQRGAQRKPKQLKTPKKETLPWHDERPIYSLYVRLEPTLADAFYERMEELQFASGRAFLYWLIVTDLVFGDPPSKRRKDHA